jgi:hypothetical protein
MVGLSAGPIPGGIDALNATLDDGSSALDANHLKGWTWYGSAGAAGGPGAGCAQLKIGDAKGQVNRRLNAFAGLDLGLDIYAGYSAIFSKSEGCCK